MITNDQSIRLQTLIEDVVISAVALDAARSKDKRTNAVLNDYIDALKKKDEKSNAKP